jgi:LysR family transcriptional regulator, transcriptional activator of nhaA
MAPLNYRHLYYFWVVAREGSVTRASSVLHLTQPAVSAQIHKLERALGEKLFARTGRNLVLTEAGRTTLRHADEIFRSGQELVESLRGGGAGRPPRLVVGVADSLPKLLGYRLLRPALEVPGGVELVVLEDHPDRLLAELSVHRLDLVLMDSPLPPAAAVRAYNHLLGECGVTLFAAAGLAAGLREGFPGSLDGAPFVLPTESSTLRRSLEPWFEANGVRPRIVAQVADSAMMKAFGRGGVGVFPAPSAVEDEVVGHYEVEVVGRLDGVRERFYAISGERRIRHPGVVAISEAAREGLFEASWEERRQRRAAPGATSPALPDAAAAGSLPPP